MVKNPPKLFKYCQQFFYVEEQIIIVGLSQSGACIDLNDNHSEYSLKGNLSNATTTVNPPLFSLGNTFKGTWYGMYANFEFGEISFL